MLKDEERALERSREVSAGLIVGGQEQGYVRAGRARAIQWLRWKKKGTKKGTYLDTHQTTA
jgi:hypothetical protein